MKYFGKVIDKNCRPRPYMYSASWYKKPTKHEKLNTIFNGPKYKKSSERRIYSDEIPMADWLVMRGGMQTLYIKTKSKEVRR